MIIHHPKNEIITLLKGPKFFLESVGFGIFPQLMYEGEKAKKQPSLSPEDSLLKALQRLHSIVEHFEPKGAVIKWIVLIIPESA